MSSRIKKVIAITSLAATILPFGATEAFAAAPPRVRISVDVDCLPEGGIGIDLTLENEGRASPGSIRTSTSWSSLSAPAAASRA